MPQPWSHFHHPLLGEAETEVGPGGFSLLVSVGPSDTVRGASGVREVSVATLENIFCNSLHVSPPRGLAEDGVAVREAEGGCRLAVHTPAGQAL